MVFGFCGGWWIIIDNRSIDSTSPIIVIINAHSLIVFGIVIIVVVCNVDSLVMVPMKIDPIVRRRIGLVGDFVSWWVFCLVRGKLVNVK